MASAPVFTCPVTAFRRVFSILFILTTVWTITNSQRSATLAGRTAKDGQCSLHNMAFCSEFTGTIGHRVLTLSDEETENKRILVIGDVHGCYTQLMELLASADVIQDDNGQRRLKDDVIIIFVGDLVNKGPESMAVLNFARTTKAVYSVMGNHELYWLQFGSDHTGQEHISYLESLPFIISIPRHNAYIVHAGLLPNLPLSDQPVDAVVHMRNVITQPDGQRPYQETDAGVHWASLWTGPQHVYFGHDARRGRDSSGNPRVQRFPLATGLDTRCVKGGALTAVVLPSENEQFYSVSCPIKYSD